MAGAAPFGFSRVVFLSHVLTAKAPVFPGDPKVELSSAATIERDGYYLQRLICGEQSGTHWAAAAHFSPGEPSADQLEAADFFLSAAILDRRAEATSDRDYTVDLGDITRWEADFGPIPSGSAVLLLTGYDERIHDSALYLGGSRDGRLHYPGFSGEVAQWLVEHRGIRALGTDTMGIDPGADDTFAANQALLHGHRLHLENLRGLAELPPVGGWIIVGGLRTQAGSGSPATVFGLIP